MLYELFGLFVTEYEPLLPGAESLKRDKIKRRCQMYDTAESWLPNMIQS